MPFSTISRDRLSSAHKDLQILFNEIDRLGFECSIIYGFRGKDEQQKAFYEGKSKLQWPDSPHNQMPSHAVDVAPWDKELKIDWNDIKRFYYFAGWVKAIAKKLKEDDKISHDIRWGGDWDDDTETKDNTFSDLVHFEIKSL
jgi:peptidoglycan L-alanyl-D-glutamate endopeptidase CwlK